MIKFTNVSKDFGDIRAVSNISFEIEPGEFVFFQGRSGAGKTTIARLMIRQYVPTKGEIQVGEFSVHSMKKKEVPILRQQVGVVFQDFRLLQDRTAAENIALVLEILNKRDEAIKATVTELLKVAGLEDRGHLFPRQMSGGEIQRVAIARALALEPAILFADEPTGNLDMKTAWEIMDLLERINKEGTTVIMSTHNEEIVEKMDKRVIVLENGEITGDTKKIVTEKQKKNAKKVTSDDKSEDEKKIDDDVKEDESDSPENKEEKRKKENENSLKKAAEKLKEKTDSLVKNHTEED